MGIDDAAQQAFVDRLDGPFDAVILNAGVFGGSWRFPGTDGTASYRIEHYTDGDVFTADFETHYSESTLAAVATER